MLSKAVAAAIVLIGAITVLAGLAAFDMMPAPGTPASIAVDEPTRSASHGDAYGDCVTSFFPSTAAESRANAERVIRACSVAIQSRTLTPLELAHARLNRGVARMIVGDSVLYIGDYLEALRHYDSAIDPMNPDALALYRSGSTLEGTGQVEGALHKYAEAIKVDPKLALAYYGRGLLLATRERAYVRAIADFDKVLTLAPNNVTALIQRGDAYSQIGDFGHALADLDRAIRLDRANPRAYVVRGLVNHRRGDNVLAFEDYGRAIEIEPDRKDALRNRGALYATTGQPDRAIHDFDVVIALSPTDPMAFFDRGYAFFAKRQYQLAVIDYGTAIFLDPEMGAAYLNRCLTLVVEGRDLVSALADCDRALKLMPASIAARETRGFVYLKLGDPAIAMIEYEAVLRMDANRPLALYGLGLAKIRMGRKAEGGVDQAAAAILNPAVAAEFALYGVE